MNKRRSDGVNDTSTPQSRDADRLPAHGRLPTWMVHNRGLRFTRTRYEPPKHWLCDVNRERVFYEKWAEENEPRPWLNNGNGILQDLFIAIYSTWMRKKTHHITRRERMIVATVIQWLGSNCGWCFLEECIRACGYRLVRQEQSNEPNN